MGPPFLILTAWLGDLTNLGAIGVRLAQGLGSYSVTLEKIAEIGEEGDPGREEW